MNGYLPPHEACEKTGISIYTLTKLIEQGKVRTQETTDITSSSSNKLKFVCLDDISDALDGRELEYVDISLVGSEYGITPSAVRYQIKRGRLRWRRQGDSLQSCKPDLDQFVEGATSRPSGRPKGTIRESVHI